MPWLIVIVLDRVELEDVDRVWPYVADHIKAGCEAVTTEVTPEWIRAEALADRRIIWVVIDLDNPFPFLAAASMGWRATNRGLVAFVDAIGGRDAHRWLNQCLGELEGHLKAAGAVAIEVEGRRGWRRVLPGYREKRVVMSKDL